MAQAAAPPVMPPLHAAFGAEKDVAASHQLAPIVAILNEPTSKQRRTAVVRSDGSCYWLDDNANPWRKPVHPSGGPAISAAWRPLSGSRSIIAIGYHSHVVLCDVPPQDARPTFICLERRVELPIRADQICWSPRGRGLLVSSTIARSAVSIDAAWGRIDGTFTPGGPRSVIHSMNWSISGNLFVSSGPPYTFRIFSGETLSLVDTWICKGAVQFGDWSVDGTRLVCGSELDGIIVIDVKTKQQWLVISPDNLRQLAIKHTGSENDFRIKQIAWDPKSTETLALVFSNAKSIAFVRLISVGKLMNATVLSPSETIGSCACIRFHPGNKESILLAPEGAGALIETKSVSKA